MPQPKPTSRSGKASLLPGMCVQRAGASGLQALINTSPSNGSQVSAIAEVGVTQAAYATLQKAAHWRSNNKLVCASGKAARAWSRGLAEATLLWLCAGCQKAAGPIGAPNKANAPAAPAVLSGRWCGNKLTSTAARSPPQATSSHFPGLTTSPTFGGQLQSSAADLQSRPGQTHTIEVGQAQVRFLVSRCGLDSK